MTTPTVNYERTGEAVPLVMMIRRAALIDALRSGKYHQGTGVLFWSKFDDSGSFCCIGVACHLIGQSPELLAKEEIFSYLNFEEQYGASHRVCRYLMAMNDGYTFHEYDKKIRHTVEQRDFLFIARFLEILWKMSEN